MSGGSIRATVKRSWEVLAGDFRALVQVDGSKVPAEIVVPRLMEPNERVSVVLAGRHAWALAPDNSEAVR